MTFDYCARTRIAIALLIFLALLSSFRLFTDSKKFDWDRIGNDDITRYEKRFDGIRQFLPSHGTIGYSAAGLNRAEYWKSDWPPLRNWFLTQYTLAPVVVSITSNNRITIINDVTEADTTSTDDADFTILELAKGTKVFNFVNGVKVVMTE